MKNNPYGAFHAVPLLVAALCLGTSLPAHATRWLEIGDTGTEKDKGYVDTESLIRDGDYRIFNVMTVYDRSRVNAHDIRLDRYIQKVAFDCTGKATSPISTIGFMDGRQVGASPERADWRSNFSAVPDTAFAQRALTLACTDTATMTPANPAAPLRSSSGTGIVINRGGYILTNHHVAANCRKLSVESYQKSKTPATLEAIDARNDLALIRTAQQFSDVASFRQQDKPARLGEAIGVMGFPLSTVLSSEAKATFGQVNALAGPHNDYATIQISAPIQPGNSGGPVLDGAGNVIGVVVSQASMELARRVGSIPQNVNFAIRGELAQIFMSAHGVDYSVAKAGGKKLETDEVAENAQRFTVLIRCN